MSITIPLSIDEETRLAERAARIGQDLTGYVIELDIQAPVGADLALAPFRRQVAESGLSDDELGDFFEEARDEARREESGDEGVP